MIIVPDTSYVSTNRGLVTTREIVNKEDYQVLTNGLVSYEDYDVVGVGITAKVFEDSKHLIRVETEKGYRVLAHPDTLVYTQKSGLRKVSDLTKSDSVAIQTDRNILRPMKGDDEEEVTDGFVLGALVHNGSIIFDYENPDEDDAPSIYYQMKFVLAEQGAFTIVHDRILKLFDDPKFDLDFDQENFVHTITYKDRRVVEWFSNYGYDKDSSHISDKILKGSGHLVSGFIQGMFSTVGELMGADIPKKYNNKKGSLFTVKAVARGIHLLLLETGVVSHLVRLSHTHWLVYSTSDKNLLKYYSSYDKISNVVKVLEKNLTSLEVEPGNSLFVEGILLVDGGENEKPA